MTISFLNSCKKKKDDPVPLCENGFLDPGETSPDCGGNCPPCSNINPIYTSMKINGVTHQLPTRQLVFDGTKWILSLSNDTISFSFNLGSNGSISSYSMSDEASFAEKNSIEYPNQTNGEFIISQHNTTDKTMSGFFNADFSRVGYTDTIRVTDGVFEYLTY